MEKMEILQKKRSKLGLFWLSKQSYYNGSQIAYIVHWVQPNGTAHAIKFAQLQPAQAFFAQISGNPKKAENQLLLFLN